MVKLRSLKDIEFDINIHTVLYILYALFTVILLILSDYKDEVLLLYVAILSAVLWTLFSLLVMIDKIRLELGALIKKHGKL